MLYTRKGDDGTTKTFGCDQRISKSSAVTEALGALDEINSFLGLVKIKSEEIHIDLQNERISISETVEKIQQDLFIIQAEVAGADKTISEEKVLWLEEIINGVERKMPPIKTFFVSGGSELAVFSDIARTIARRAERRVVAVFEEGKVEVKKYTLSYLNRLSSVLYAFARISNYMHGIDEKSPDYK